MTARAVLHVERIGFQALSAHARHHRREIGDCTHVDPARSKLNHSVGLDDCPEKAVQQYLNATGAKIDKRNTTPVTRLLLSASPAYFRPGREAEVGAFDRQRVQDWVSVSMEWLRKEFGKDLVHVALHLDESTPHLHAVVVPTYEKNLKRGKRLQVSHHQHPAFSGRGSYEVLQDRFGEAVSTLGVERGRRLPKDLRTTHKAKREWLSGAIKALRDERKQVSLALAMAEAASRAVGLLQRATDLQAQRKKLRTRSQDLTR